LFCAWGSVRCCGGGGCKWGGDGGPVFSAFKGMVAVAAEQVGVFVAAGEGGSGGGEKT